MTVKPLRLLAFAIPLLLAVAAACLVLRDGCSGARVVETRAEPRAAAPGDALPVADLQSDAGREPVAPAPAAPAPPAAPDSEELVFPPFPELAGPGWRICGRVTGDDGRPVAGARVAALFDQNLFGSTTQFATAASPVFTDQAGGYAVSVPAPEWARPVVPRELPFPGNCLTTPTCMPPSCCPTVRRRRRRRSTPGRSTASGAIRSSEPSKTVPPEKRPTTPARSRSPP